MPITTRAYDDGDYETCRDLWIQLTEHHRQIYSAPHIGGDDPGGKLDEYLARSSRIGTWVAVDGSAVVGMVGLQHFDDESDVEVEPMIVDRGRRSEGIGATLIERAVAEARTLGIRSLSVRVVGRNASAMAFYHAAGFRTIGLVELFVPLDESTTEWRDGVTIHDLDFAF